MNHTEPVPLAVSHPTAELTYVLQDTAPAVVVAHPSLLERAREAADVIAAPVIRTDVLLEGPPDGPLPNPGPDRAAFV